MLTLALDPSSTSCGWALFRGTMLAAHGTTRRKGNSLTAYAREFASEVRAAVKLYPDEAVVEVWYEINDGAPIPRKRQKSMRKQAQGTGRLLQALGLEGHEKQADNRKKEKRARDTSLIYGIPMKPTKTWEHELDSIALGHRIVNDEKRLAPAP